MIRFWLHLEWPSVYPVYYTSPENNNTGIEQWMDGDGSAIALFMVVNNGSSICEPLLHFEDSGCFLPIFNVGIPILKIQSMSIYWLMKHQMKVVIMISIALSFSMDFKTLRIERPQLNHGKCEKQTNSPSTPPNAMTVPVAVVLSFYQQP